MSVKGIRVQGQTDAVTLVEQLQCEGMDTSDLGHVGVRPPLPRYIRDLWERRHFILMDSRMRAASQHHGNLLGNKWLILKPLLDVIFYWLIFGVVLHAGGGTENYVAFIVIGVLMFQSSARALTAGTSVMRQGRSLIKSFSFPRAAIPIASVVQETINLVPVVVVMLISIIVIPTHELPTLTWLLLPVVLLAQTLLNVGMTLVVARIGFVFPDMAHAMGFVSRILMYGSGVLFPIDRFLDHTVVVTILNLNPLFAALTMYREILMQGVWPHWSEWAVLLGWGIALTVVGFIFFWKKEAKYGGGQ
ncbi:ABC transporter permease [Devriesea agamarum]|uniref:ABC transporter permease n=1 Tax=Devriesea agamarum TaxID=472569 RepID=UPI00071E0D9B|nr:ABC transporter permease [Devriesea agamarum]